jgi:RNA polymerase sigma-70 factor (ECF subfamily)
LPRAAAAAQVRRSSRDARSDLELLEAIRAGDATAFDILYDRYFQRVYHFSYARVRNRADAEEAVQETFTAVYRSIDAYRGQSSLLSWIYGIAKNTVNNHIRRARAQEQRVERAEDDLVRDAESGLESFTPEDRLGLRRCAEAIDTALSSVTPWQAEVFVLRHFEDLPIQEIADRMHRSNDAIRSSLYRVKRLVVQAVDPELAGAI